MTADPSRPRLACFVVTRDDADRLPAWLAGVRPLADVIIALDEGSSDGSVALLEREPLVRTVLQSEPGGLAAAINRLLDAADALDPEWLLWLDAGERVAPDDVEPLRDFLAHDALPGLAYGLRSDDGDVRFRLFAHSSGQRVAPGSSADAMVPSTIPQTRWMATTLRLEPATGAAPVRDRAADTPVLARSDVEERPVMSAVVIAQDDGDAVEAAVGTLLEQECPESFEVIVVTNGADRTANRVRDRFAEVEVVELRPAGLPGDMRNAGLARARGDYVAFFDAGLEALEGSLAARVRAHDWGHLLVTGRVLNGTRTYAGWAAYFLDHAALSSRSYVRELLVALGGFPADMRAGEDTAVDVELARRGRGAYREPNARMVHRTRCRTARELVRRHFARGRAAARIGLDRAPGHLVEPASRRALGRVTVPASGLRLRARYAWSFPLVAAAVTATRVGYWFEAVRGLGIAQLGFAGTDEPPPPPGSGAQERGHSGAVLGALYPLHERHPWLARVPVRMRKSTRRALTHVAVRAHLRRCRNVAIVAITGSAGKTTTKDLLGEMLAAGGPTVRTRANENGLWGVPCSLLAIRPSDRFAVIEVGIKRAPGEMRWMAGLFRPRVAILTGIGTFHSEVFGSAAAIAREKRPLLERLGSRGTAVVNADDPIARSTAAGLPCRVLLAGWAADADVRLLAARSAWPHGLDLELAVHGRPIRARVAVHGRHLAPLVAMAVAAAEAVGVSAVDALDAAGAFSPRVARLSPAPGPRESMLIVDDWKSRVPSAVAAVEALGDTRARRRVAVLGEVQVDEQTTDTYRPIADALVTAADRVVAVGRAGPPLQQLLAQTDLAPALLQVADAEAASAALSEELGPGDVALLHGAGDHDLEQIGLRLDPDTDPAWIDDWRRRPFSRFARTVIEILAVLDPGDDLTILEQHGDALTYAATTGHRLTREGQFVPAGDADVVARSAQSGVAPLLALRAAVPDREAAVSRAVAAILEHMLAHGHCGLLLDLDGSSATGPRVQQLLTTMTDHLRAEGRWSGIVLRGPGGPRYGAAVEAVDLAVLHLHRSGGRPSWAGQVERVLAETGQACALLLHAPADDLALGSSLVRDFGLRGLAVRASSVGPAIDPIAQRFQIRQRAWRI